MIINRLRSFSEYSRFAKRMESTYALRYVYEQELQRDKQSSFNVSGFSYPAKKMVDFLAEFSNGTVNWRECLTCPECQLNSRLRGAIHLLDSELGLNEDEEVYITEQVTPMYNYLAKRAPKLIGSEYLGSSVSRGDTNATGVRNEDLTNLSFLNDSFDLVLSFECLEHIPNFNVAIREMYRVLRPNGRTMWTVPFRRDLKDNLIRASLGEDGKVIHHLPAEYHGDPISQDGCLCFTHFGWEMLDQFRVCGFSDVYALAYWSDVFGYLGEHLTFIAIK